MPAPEGFEKVTPEQQAQPAGGLPEGFTKIETQPSRLQRQARGLGIGTRAVGEGFSEILGILNDPLVLLTNLGLRQLGFNEMVPTREAASQLLSGVGLPEPRTAGERVQSSVIRGGTGAMTMMAGGAGLAKQAPLVSQMLMATPLLELFAGSAAGGGAQVAEEMGAGPGGQLIAALAAGAGFPASAVAVNRLARAPGMLTGPLTRSGVERGTAELLADSATDPIAASSRLRSQADEIVPGSPPTAGPVSQDVGILSLEKALRNTDPQRFTPTLSQQNMARRAYLESIIEDADELRDLRDATGGLREAAFNEARPVVIAPVIGRIDEIMASPAGKRDAVNRSLDWLRSKMDGVTDPLELYEIRKEIGDAMDGRLSGDQSGFRLARKELISVRQLLDEQIEQVAPGFREYLSEYSKLSRRIEQSDRLSEIRDRKVVSISDPTTGEGVFSPGSFRQTVNADRLNRMLTDEQMRVLETIAADLDRGAAITSGLIRPTGSDTANNVTMSQIIGRSLVGGRSASPAIEAMLKPFEFIRGLSANAQRDLLFEAVMDPALAGELLKKANTSRASIVSDALRVKAMNISAGAGAGALQAQPNPDTTQQGVRPAGAP